MTKEELEKSLNFVNEERERLQIELERKDNIINELKNELYHIYNYAGLEIKDLEDKIKDIENGNK